MDSSNTFLEFTATGMLSILGLYRMMAQIVQPELKSSGLAIRLTG